MASGIRHRTMLSSCLARGNDAKTPPWAPGREPSILVVMPRSVTKSRRLRRVSDPGGGEVSSGDEGPSESTPGKPRRWRDGINWSASAGGQRHGIKAKCGNCASGRRGTVERLAGFVSADARTRGGARRGKGEKGQELVEPTYRPGSSQWSAGMPLAGTPAGGGRRDPRDGACKRGRAVVQVPVQSPHA